MEKKVIDKHMDKHLENVQYEARVALDRFGEYGMKIDKKFLSHFLKATIERLNQTCKRYGTESKWKISDKMPNAKATTSTAKATEATKRTTSKATATTTATATATTTTTMAATTTSTNPPVRAPITTTASGTSAKDKLMEAIDLTSDTATKRLSKDATETEHSTKKRKSNKTDGKN
ncbi:mucin-5AC-like, partial [Sitodiplosis mosellana]|uniref:mucin-5AC-like n=1 Tax=Sitodiplosis mosellana TaxID=263140 RepID=UPI00244424E8